MFLSDTQVRFGYQTAKFEIAKCERAKFGTAKRGESSEKHHVYLTLLTMGIYNRSCV